MLVCLLCPTSSKNSATVAMRLIDVECYTFASFSNETELPKYAILSHRWMEDEEILFKDFLKHRNKHLAGWQKVRFCCEQAIKDGLRYVWIDTCCIDKSSSAELSEAINSMYRWYANSQICYAYLNDVVDEGDEASWEAQLMKSTWFTRSWTLQELLAPKSLMFFDMNGKTLNSRTNLCLQISEASGINVLALVDELDLMGWSIAQRMSWAAHRQATRVEDIAYSLLGLFDVNIPLLYGEGSKAFHRLQEEILRQSNDETIFAWSIHESEELHVVRDHSTSYEGIRSLLAPSPASFNHCDRTVSKAFHPPRPFSITNMGLSVEFPMELWLPRCYWTGLNCTNNSTDQIGIWLLQDFNVPNLFSRITLTMPVDSAEYPPLQKNHLIPSVSSDLKTRDVLNLKCERREIYVALQTYYGKLGLPFNLQKLPGIFVKPALVSRKVSPREMSSGWPRTYPTEEVVTESMDHNHLSRRAECFPRYTSHTGLFLCVSRSGDRPPIGIMHVLDYSDVASKYIVAVKLGFDRQFRPFAILQERSAKKSDESGGSTNPPPALRSALSVKAASSLSSRSFWECSGLETKGWIEPNQGALMHPQELQPGLWPLRAGKAALSVFMLNVATFDGEKRVVEVGFERTDVGPRHYNFHITEIKVDNFDVSVRKSGSGGSVFALTQAYVKRLGQESTQKEKQRFDVEKVADVLHRSTITPWDAWLQENYGSGHQDTPAIEDTADSHNRQDLSSLQFRGAQARRRLS